VLVGHRGHPAQQGFREHRGGDRGDDFRSESTLQIAGLDEAAEARQPRLDGNPFQAGHRPERALIQMLVGVHQSREADQAPAIDDLVDRSEEARLFRQAGTDRLDDRSVDQHIAARDLGTVVVEGRQQVERLPGEQFLGRRLRLGSDRFSIEGERAAAAHQVPAVDPHIAHVAAR